MNNKIGSKIIELKDVEKVYFMQVLLKKGSRLEEKMGHCAEERAIQEQINKVDFYRY